MYANMQAGNGTGNGNGHGSEVTIVIPHLDPDGLHYSPTTLALAVSQAARVLGTVCDDSVGIFITEGTYLGEGDPEPVSIIVGYNNGKLTEPERDLLREYAKLTRTLLEIQRLTIDINGESLNG